MSGVGVRRLVFVLACLLCLLALTTALPAADPRLDVPGDHDDGTVAGSWEQLESTPEFPATESPGEQDDTEADDDGDADEPETDGDIDIRGSIEPGNEVRVDTGYVGPLSSSGQTIEVNGEAVGETDEFGRATIEVPFTTEMTVSVAEDSRTVDVETNATITADDSGPPATAFDVSARVGDTPLEGATVFVDDEAVAETDELGHATVTLPERAGSAKLRVEREPVTGTETVRVAEPEVSFLSSLVFPGSPAPVQVSADGTPVPDASVTVDGGENATTGGDGRATLWVPIDDEATVTARIGEETATATVTGLYRRLGVVAIVVPGLVIGVTVTYLRVGAIRHRRRRRLFASLFVFLGEALEGTANALSTLGRSLGQSMRGFTGSLTAVAGRRPSLSPLASLWSSFSSGRRSWSLPSFRLPLSSLGSALGSLSSVGSLFDRSTRSRDGIPGRSLLETLRSRDDREEADAPPEDDDGPALTDEALAPRGPRAEIRAVWHTFLDHPRLELRNRETLTVGQAGRRALAVGFPAETVSRLVSIVRDVEYGNREPSPTRVQAATEHADELCEHDPVEDETP